MTQYARRISQQDPFYATLAAELMTHPFVFVGTSLDESPLWQHIELRRGKGLGGEMRPQSFLVTPQLDRARADALSQFNIEWVPMTAEQFANDVLRGLEDVTPKGISAISKKNKKVSQNADELVELSTIIGDAVKTNVKTDYLLGREPTWSDIHCGRAIEREVDVELWKNVSEICKKKEIKGSILISGTAGSGKSSSLMRLAMRLSFAGFKIGWVDRDHEASVATLRRAFRHGGTHDVLAIDDANELGADLAATIREICADKPFPLVLIAIRSGRIDRVLNSVQLGATPLTEYVMPPLTNSDISGLIKVLTDDNKLGKLRGLPRGEQEQMFRDRAGRELIVAMIEATSGERFEDKAVHEYEELDSLKRQIYALVATATVQNFPLDRTNLLLALGRKDNEALNATEQLVKRNILVGGGEAISYRARHRVIGELIQKNLQNSGQLYQVLAGLLSVLAAQVHPGMQNHAKPKRLLAKMINHTYLHHVLGPEHARQLYTDLEEHLKTEAHYWLQRGVHEIETGNLRVAKNYLDQAKGINPNDDYVEVEYALWQFRTALESPHDPKSPELVAHATEALDEQIRQNGEKNHHAYHVLGSQTIGWIRRSHQGYDDKKNMLLHALTQVKAGVQFHPKNEALNRLHKELEDERLNLVMRR